jgi:hypothetical protein
MTSSTTNGKIDRERVKRTLEAAFRQQFPTDTVDISDGYGDNIHVLVVSRQFDTLSEQVKDDLMWSIIQKAPLSDDERHLISLVMPVSPAEIK